MITENLSTFKIHRLSQEQYDTAVETGNIDEDAIYLTPEGDLSVIVDENGDAWIGYADEIAQLPEGIPNYTEAENNKVLTVVNGEAIWAEAVSGIPEYIEADEGKFLRIVNGVPAWVTVPNAEGVSF